MNIPEPDVDGPLDRPIFTDLFVKSRLIGILYVFPNAASLWLAIVSTLFFTVCMSVGITMFDPALRLILPIGLLGGVICIWALISEVIALIAEVYAIGRMDEYERLQDVLEVSGEAEIINWPLAPHG